MQVKSSFFFDSKRMQIEKKRKKTTSPVTVLALYEFIFLQPKQTASFSQHRRHFRLQFKHGYSTQTSGTPTCQKTIKVSQTHTQLFKKKKTKKHTKPTHTHTQRHRQQWSWFCSCELLTQSEEAEEMSTAVCAGC